MRLTLTTIALVGLLTANRAQVQAQAPGTADEPETVEPETVETSNPETPPEVAAGSESTETVGTAKRSRYEAEALGIALARKGVEVDPSPEGKTVGRILVDNQPVFSPRDGFLTMFNVLHVTTKESVIDREVLLRPGQAWDSELIDETRRKLTDPLYTTLVVITPVKSQTPGQVDLLVVTRDIWSLRLNSQYEIQQSKLTGLSFSLSENNLFGRRKTAALSFSMDQGDIFVGPIYIDKNVMGTRMRFSSSAGPLFARSDGAFEGTRSTTSLAYPLWSSRSKWAADIGFSHFVGKVRFFDGTELATYDNERTEELEEVPFLYDLANYNLEGGVTRSFGYPFIIRLRAGYDLRINRPTVPDEFGFDDSTRTAFVTDVFPRSERSSAVFFRTSAFLNKFKVFRNINTYDLPEDVRLGPSMSATISSSLKLIGSEENFFSGSLSASYGQAVGDDSLLQAAVSTSSRLQSGDLVDRTAGMTLAATGPVVANLFRPIAQFAIVSRTKDINNRFFTLGGDNGLRGFAINRFRGDRRVRGNIELRGLPYKLWFGRIGGTVFYDTGHAADVLSELQLQHDVGFGIRGLVPQLQRTVFRFDLAVPLSGDTPGFSGFRFSSGIRQAF